MKVLFFIFIIFQTVSASDSDKQKYEYIIKQKLCELPMVYTKFMLSFSTTSDAAYDVKILNANDKGHHKEANKLENDRDKEKLKFRKEKYTEAEKLGDMCNKELKVQIVRSKILNNTYLLNTRVELPEEIQKYLEFYFPTVDLKIKLNKVFDSVSIDTICYDKKVIYPLPYPNKVVNNQCF